MTSARTFDFTSQTTYGTAIPEEAGKTTREPQLPFRAWFTDNVEAARDAKQPHIFVPKAYWVEERGVVEDKVTNGYQRAKIRSQFNEWRKAHEGHDDLVLLMVNRTKGQAGFEEDGLSVWLTVQK